MGREILELQGYKILDAENGIEALKVSEEHEGEIHLMITDVVMPKMGGGPPPWCSERSPERP